MGMQCNIMMSYYFNVPSLLIFRKVEEVSVQDFLKIARYQNHSLDIYLFKLQVILRFNPRLMKTRAPMKTRIAQFLWEVGWLKNSITSNF